MQRFIAIVLTLITTGYAFAGDPVPPPKSVPPVLGTAVVSDRGKGGAAGEWEIKLTAPKIEWEVVNSRVAEYSKVSRHLEAEVQMTAFTLLMDKGEQGQIRGPRARVTDVNGTDLTRQQVVKRLEKETPVLISLSGQMPDPYYLQLTKPDALIVILSDRHLNSDLLPVKKANKPTSPKLEPGRAQPGTR